MSEINKLKQCHAPVLSSPLEHQSTYQVEGKSFIVTPVFRQEGMETLGSVLVKLMRMESAQDH